jgi:hypothetical protein
MKSLWFFKNKLERFQFQIKFSKKIWNPGSIPDMVLKKINLNSSFGFRLGSSLVPDK